ncbi:hypothetical protein DFH11DRAFT_1588422 [Phellopilus nigrolimitatus]|nr:hypothetical protein DFH11DRAFT_1588422 [Phellopilus nigrolimitatus]
MAFHMSVFDLLHRAVLFGLVGMGAGGLMLGFQVHRDVLRRGKGGTFFFFFLHFKLLLFNIGFIRLKMRKPSRMLHKQSCGLATLRLRSQPTCP